MATRYKFTMNYVFRDATCPICGKNFIPAVGNIYKIKKRVKGQTKTLDCCSYTCWRKGGGDEKPKKLRGGGLY